MDNNINPKYRELAEKLYKHFNREEVPVSKEELEKYMEGSLDKANMHRVEEKLLSSPFASEGLQGLSELENKDILREIDAEIDKKTHSKNGSGNTAIQKLMIAASVAALCLISYFTFDYFSNQLKKNEMAIEKTEESAPEEPKYFEEKDLIQEQEQIVDEEGENEINQAPLEKKDRSPLRDEKQKVKSAERKKSQEKTKSEDIEVVEDLSGFADEEEAEAAWQEEMPPQSPVNNDADMVLREDNEQSDGDEYRSGQSNAYKTEVESQGGVPASGERNNSDTYNYPIKYYYDLKAADYRKEYSLEYEKKKSAESNNTPPVYENEKSKEEATRTLDKLSEKNTITYEALLKKALKAYKDKEYSLAINHFSIIRTHHPEDVNAQFYTGLSHYELGHYQKAKFMLNKAITNEVKTHTEEAKWYKALCLIELEDTGNAREILNEIVDEEGFYSEAAMRKLKQLE